METAKKPNHLLRYEREKRGWSQRKLAELLDTGEEVVSRWERGERKTSPFYQEQLCRIFGKDAVELGFLDSPPLHVPPEVPQAAKEHVASRRDPKGEDIINQLGALQNIGRPDAVFPVFSQELPNLRPWERHSSVPVEPLYIDEETLHHFATLTALCRHLSEGNELKIAESILWTYLPRVEIVARLSAKYQDIAASIASQGYLLAASLIGHRNDLLGRLRYSEQAFRYGELAGDLNLQMVALRQLAVTFDYLARPDKVLQTYQRTFPYLHEISPLVRACVYAGVSGAYAQLHQEQEAYRFLGLAYEHFPEKAEDQSDFLNMTCSYSTLVSWQALNYLELGRPQEAEKTFSQIDGLQPKRPIPERVRIELLNYQAETFTVLRNMEQACIYLEAAVKASGAIGSERRLQESSVVFQQIRNVWPDEQKVRDLGNLFTYHMIEHAH